MKQITKYIAIIICLLAVYSCNEWLDVSPPGDIEADEFLSTTQGMNSAIGGIYYILTDEDMHAGDLGFGTLEVMAQYFTSNVDDRHEDLYFLQYEYKNAAIRGRIDNWWKNYYTGIAQCNEILAAFEKNKDKIDTPELYEGELLGLRAFMHLQLYQLFGPVVRSEGDLEQKAIPYRVNYDNVATPFLTCREVLTNAKNDLLKALELLENDPIITGGYKRKDYNKSELDYNQILNQRIWRINYFAVMGFLVRVEQLLLNQSETNGAYYWANRVITEAEKLTDLTLQPLDWTTSYGGELVFSREAVFAFRVNNLYQITGKKFRYSLDFSYSASEQLFIDEESFDNFVNFVYGRDPDGAGTDNRLFWFNPYTVFSTLFPFHKYSSHYPSELAVLRLSEMYYAMCEALTGVDNVKALEYLNKVRTHRLLPELDDSQADNVGIYLMRERRKENLGDGTNFFLHKRLFSDIEVSPTRTIEATKNIFELPIPEYEYEFGPENKSDNN